MSLTTAFLSAAALPGQGVGREVVAMGTALRIEVEAADRETALLASEALLRAVEVVEQRLSVWREDSEVSRINAAPQDVPVTVTLATVADLRWAFAFGARVEGAFDATAGPLVAVYGLRAEPRWPDDLAVTRAHAAMGAHHFLLGSTKVTRLRRDAALDCDGFGKGVALDRGVAAAVAAGATRVFCDFGGQVINAGPKAAPVEVAIADPGDRSRTVRKLRLAAGRSAATSGNSERKAAVDGKPLGHLLDPRTGLPARDFGSVTVIAASAAEADAAATALFVLGPERGLEVADRLRLEAVFAVREPASGELRFRSTRHR